MLCYSCEFSSPNKISQYNNRAQIVYAFRALDGLSILEILTHPQDTNWLPNSAKPSFHFTCIWFLKVGISANVFQYKNPSTSPLKDFKNLVTKLHLELYIS